MRINYVNFAEMFEGIQGGNNARKLGEQPDELLAVNQIDTYTIVI